MRIRPANGHERDGDWLVRKVSDDSVTVGDRKFTFDSVLDSKSNQVSILFLYFYGCSILFSDSVAVHPV